MVDFNTLYENELKTGFDSRTKKERLKHFHRAMKIRAEKTAREQIAVNETELLHALRGQLTILYELADFAVSALDSEKSDAKDDTENEIPSQVV